MTKEQVKEHQELWRSVKESRNRDLVDVEVSEALCALRKRYPQQKVSIRIVFYPSPAEPIDFWASVEHLEPPTDYRVEYGRSAHEAIEKLIATVGDHNQLDFTQIKINQLEDEIAKLKRTLPDWVQPMGDNEPADQSEGYGHQQTIR